MKIRLAIIPIILSLLVSSAVAENFVQQSTSGLSDFSTKSQVPGFDGCFRIEFWADPFSACGCQSSYALAIQDYDPDLYDYFCGELPTEPAGCNYCRICTGSLAGSTTLVCAFGQEDGSAEICNTAGYAPIGSSCFY